jgi:SAM-dependent methyltransferase
MSDENAFKSGQRALWDATAAAWDDWHDELESWFAPINARLLDDAAVDTGKRVLDLGTGYGEPALSAGDRIGEEGEVVGIDISPAMLEVARRRAEGRGNIAFVLGDVERTALPGGFDAAISRLGLMFVVDRVATFDAIRSALALGGSLAFAVWGPAERHLISQALVPLFGDLELPQPPPEAPTPFCMSDPTALAGALEAAGFVDVSIAEVVAPVRYKSTEAFIRFNLDALPAAMLAAGRRQVRRRRRTRGLGSRHRGAAGAPPPRRRGRPALARPLSPRREPRLNAELARPAQSTEIEKAAAKVSPGGTKVSSGPAERRALVGAVIGSIATASLSAGA